MRDMTGFVIVDKALILYIIILLYITLFYPLYPFSLM